jgi:hypothetical protein
LATAFLAIIKVSAGNLSGAFIALLLPVKEQIENKILRIQKKALPLH